jgi:hypothetical protein
MSPSSFEKSISNVPYKTKPRQIPAGLLFVESSVVVLVLVPLRAQSCRAAAMAVVMVRAMEDGEHMRIQLITTEKGLAPTSNSQLPTPNSQIPTPNP